MSDQPAAFSLGRLIAVVVPVVAIAFGLQYLLSTGYEQAARDEIESNMLARLLGPTSVGPDASIEFKDADGDLVADSPPDDQCIAPQPLVFSYVASEDASEAQSDWQDVMDALGEKLNVAVEYRPYETTSDQLADLASGKLHVAGFNTGAVPVAVKSSGFVPVCTFGREDGEFGYKMLIIAPAGSAIDGPSDLQDKQVTFVRPDSNSGCKAALVLLMNKYQLLPESGYGWSFSLGHDASILGVAAGEIEAAPVASDIFQRMVDAGEVDGDKVEVIYESERFPPAALGYAHNLTSSMRDAIAETLLNFDWQGASIQEKYGNDAVQKFVPVNYKDDWANIRRVDDAVRKARAGKSKGV